MTAEIHSIVTRRNIGNIKALLHSLVPRAQCFCFYDTTPACVWSSGGADDYELDNFVADLPPEILTGREPGAEFLRRTLPSGRTLLLLAVTAEDGESLGLLIGVFSPNAGKSSWFNPKLLKEILLPAVDVIRDNVARSMKLQSSERRAAEAEKELQLVYQLDEKIHGSSRSHSGLAQLVGQSGRFLGIAYSVLLLPSKRIRISATHSSWKPVNRKSLDKYLMETLFPRLEGQRNPVVYEVPAVPGGDGPADRGYQVLLCPLTGPSGAVDGIIAQVGRVSGEPFGPAQLRFMSHIARKIDYMIGQSFDPMTGLMNRAGFEAQIHESIKMLEGPDDVHQMIYFDLDNLQLVNDTFGHEAGDEVIKRFGQMLESMLPKTAVVSRLTGDDFAVMLTYSSSEEAMELATRVRERSNQLRYLEGDKSLQVTVSAGITDFNAAIPDENRILTVARIACDAAKDHGRDRIEIHDQDNHSIIRRFDDMHLVSEIQKSLDTDNFGLVAQPIVALGHRNRAPKFEVLLRMRNADAEPVSSKALFSAAERYQLMPQIDRWVVSTTLSMLAPYAEFLRKGGGVFAINLSGQSLGDGEILKFILDEVESSGLQPSSICFEVTESAAVANLRQAQSFINTLCDKGFRFALDDFGAGLSSFAYLKNFRVDTLKIDGSFVRDITENQISESMVAAITQVAKVMDLQTVAEFVESREIQTLVGKLGVDYAQGHAIGHPMPLDRVLAELSGAPRAFRA